jgi:pimeloyl-ACP methyl ester carboxylesterase
MAPTTHHATQPLIIPVRNGQIAADLRRPEQALGLVVFAHGSGSSRFSSRNRAVAQFLEHHRFATLLVDLLTRDEERVDSVTAEFRFDIDLLAERVIAATDWIALADDVGSLPLGYFGASTGAAAALMAAAERPAKVHAVVSRGGRPDLAGTALTRVQAPTLLIVGGDDEPVIEMNEHAMRQMNALVELKIVPGASHLFEETGTLEQVMQLASDWFGRYLTGPDVQDGLAPGER